MSQLLQRELFETKRRLEYFSGKELSMQLGAEPGCWGVVLIKRHFQYLSRSIVPRSVL